jgi:hypothetical protein
MRDTIHARKKTFDERNIIDTEELLQKSLTSGFIILDFEHWGAGDLKSTMCRGSVSVMCRPSLPSNQIQITQQLYKPTLIGIAYAVAASRLWESMRT